MSKVQPPVIGKRTGVGQALDEFFTSLNLPLRQWDMKRRQELKGKKF